MTAFISEKTRLGKDFSRRKAVETDVFRDFELFRNMGTGSIDDHHKKVVGICRRVLCEEGAEGFGVHFLGEHPVQSPIDWADGSVNIGELAFVAVVDDGSHGRGAQQRRIRTMRAKRASS